MNKELETILNEQSIAQDNANALIKAFGAPFTDAGEILQNYQSIKVTKEDDFALMTEAREKRLALKNIRVSVEKKRKELKEDSLRVGRAIDSVARFVKDTIEPAEKYLEDQEKFAEKKAAERAAAKRAARIEKLADLTDDISLYNFDDMSDDQFDALVSQLKLQKEAEIAAKRKAEEERIAAEVAERERQAAIEAENAKLKDEAEKREKELAAERERIQAEADKKLAKERALAEAERKKREELEAEQRTREDAERAKREEIEEAQRQALLAPDKEKLLKLATDLEEFSLPALSSKDAQAVLDQVEGLLEKVTTYIRGNVKGL